MESSALSPDLCPELALWSPQNAYPCQYDLWTVLELDAAEWQHFDKFTLRLSWPAYVRDMLFGRSEYSADTITSILPPYQYLSSILVLWNLSLKPFHPPNHTVHVGNMRAFTQPTWAFSPLVTWMASTLSHTMKSLSL